MATVVIIGGGIGGLSAAIALSRGLVAAYPRTCAHRATDTYQGTNTHGRLGSHRAPSEHRIIVVERDGTQYFPPSLLWVMDGRRTAESIMRNVAPIVSRGIIPCQDEAINLDLDRRTVLTKSEELSYDFLILSPGVEYAPEMIPGLKESLEARDSSGHPGGGFNLYTMEGALGLRGALQAFTGGDIAIVAPPGPYRCPPVPYEVAMMLHGYFQKTGKRKRVKISVFTPEVLPFEAAGKRAGVAILNHLRCRGIIFEGERHLARVDPTRRLLRFREGIAPYDLLICIPPVRPPAIVRQSGFATNGHFVPVDSNFLETRYDNAYAIGDVTEITLPSGRLMPKMGAVAHLQSLVVAGNIIRKITGKGKLRSFSGTIPCIIELGRSRALVTFGNLYNPAPELAVFPSLPLLWTAGKVLIERNWLRERDRRD